MSHGSDESDNYWPGYVDALTSMVQVLAFVMMMLAMAVFVLSQSVSKSAVEAIAKAVHADVKPDAGVKELTKAVMDQIERIRPPDATDKPMSPASETSASKPAAATNAPKDSSSEKMIEMRVGGARYRTDETSVKPPLDAPRLTVSFEERSFKIDQERAQALEKFVDENAVAKKAQPAIINAYAYSGDGALSEARRLAYYRAMMVRKQLIEAKVKPENIRINVKDTEDRQKGSTVEVIDAGGSGAAR